MKQSYCRIL